MNVSGIGAVQIGDQVEMRKAHPCGGMRWTVYRIGADIGLRCQTCAHRVLLTRSAFNKAVRRLIEATPTHNEDAQ
jgi:hypothetical protein